MGYNPNNAKEVDPKPEGDLPKDTILEGVVTNIEDGKVRQFIPEKVQEKWQGDLDGSAINLTVEVKVEGREGPASIQQLFTYSVDSQGETMYKTGSNMSKYHQKYGKLPEAGDRVKVISNAQGFGRVKID